MDRIMLFPGKKRKVLTLSYDDGVEQDIRLVEIMKKHGLKGTFNINTNCFAPEGKVHPEGTIHRRMDAKTAYALYENNGMEVAVHTLTHPHLDKLSPAEVTREVILDRDNIEKATGKMCVGMAYPYGTTNDGVVEVLKNCGILYSRTTVSRHNFDIPDDWLRLSATCHHNSPDLMDLAKEFAESKPRWNSQMFYLWGHAYEFEANDNWNIIEEFAEYLGGRDDIWYATNGGIFKYIKAFRSLETTADGRMVYNPTLYTLFFESDGKEFEIKPGETVKI